MKKSLAVTDFLAFAQVSLSVVVKSPHCLNELSPNAYSVPELDNKNRVFFVVPVYDPVIPIIFGILLDVNSEGIVIKVA